MVDVVVAFVGRVGAVPKIQYPKNKAGDGNGDKHKPDADGGVEQNGRKQHGRHSSRSADAGKSGVVLVFEIGGRRCCSNGDDVKHQVQQVAHTREQQGEPLLHDGPEKVQGKHVEKQVHVIGMQETGRDPAVVLFLPFLGIRPVAETVHDFAVVEGEQRDADGNGDDEVCDHGANVHFSPWVCVTKQP